MCDELLILINGNLRLAAVLPCACRRWTRPADLLLFLALKYGCVYSCAECFMKRRRAQERGFGFAIMLSRAVRGAPDIMWTAVAKAT